MRPAHAARARLQRSCLRIRTCHSGPIALNQQRCLAPSGSRRCYPPRHRDRRAGMQATSERNETVAAEYLERVRTLLGPVSAAAPEIEAARQLPANIADALRE